jgi:glycosyltransferase involved in cell wall biosynthesis
LDKKITIAHIITGLYTGGAEMMLYKLLSKTDFQRFNPVVVSLVDRGTLGDSIEKLGVPVYTIGMKSGILTWRDIIRLYRIIKEIKPDLLQGWMYHGNIACHLAMKRVPILWNIRGSHYDLKKLKKGTAAIVWLGGKLSRLPFRIINNSRESATQHVKRLKYREDKFCIIPNGFDTETFSPSDQAREGIRMELGLRKDAFLIGMFGRYHPVKDHANFLQAARRLLDSQLGENIYFVLAGRDVGHRNTELMEKIRQFQLEQYVWLLDERKDMPRLAAALDIATLCSTSEGFPNVIGEAMACGVSCVVTNVGDAAWIVGDTGTVVPPCNSELLQQAWRKHLEMGPDQRSLMGKLARQRINELFSLGSIVNQYEELYKTAVGSNEYKQGMRSYV